MQDFIVISVPLSSVSVPCLNGASQWLYVYDCSILRKYWNTWSKQFSCGSWSWICSVLKFIPLVDFGKKKKNKKNTKNQKPTQLDCWSSSAPDVTVFFMKDFLLLLLLKDFALGPSSISIASWVMKGNSVAIPSWIPLKWGRQ